MPRVDQLLTESPASVAALREGLGVVAAEAAIAAADSKATTADNKATSSLALAQAVDTKATNAAADAAVALAAANGVADTANDALSAANAAAAAVGGFETRIGDLESFTEHVNRVPTLLSPITASVSDELLSLTGVILDHVTDFDGDAISVVGLRYNNVAQTIGALFQTTHGSMQVQADGVYFFRPNATARALQAGQQANVVFTVVIRDARGADLSSAMTITVIGTNNAPIAVDDDGRIPSNKTTTGNLLANDSDPESMPMSVLRFSVDNDAEVYNVPATVNIGGNLSLTISANGDWSATPAADYVGTVPTITYTMSDGVHERSAMLYLAILAAPPPAVSNPVTFRQTGSVMTYDVHNEAELDLVPWGSLGPGTVVNIYYNNGIPYKRKIGLRARATFNAPMVIWGVTDENGNRPILQFHQSIEAPGSNPGAPNNVFTGIPANGESLGGIVIKRGATDDYYSEKPCHIRIQNLDCMGAARDNTYTDLFGGTQIYGVSAGIYAHRVKYLLVENCIIHDCGNGFFAQANNDELSHACEFITLRNNRIYGNGIVGSHQEHNLYVQCKQPVVEGNYFSQTRPGSQGSTYKSRCSGEIFRYNYVEASARAIDFVHPEDQAIDGIGLQPEYGYDYCYGNVIINDHSLPNGGAYVPLHFGGDIWEEDVEFHDASLVPLFRKTLYFFNNTYYTRLRANNTRVIMFDLSLRTTIVEAWDNVFIVDSVSYTGAEVSWVEFAGILNFRGNNVVHAKTPLLNARFDSFPNMFQVNWHTAAIVGDPMPYDVSEYDFRPCIGSVATDLILGTPGEVPAYLGDYQINAQMNGPANNGITAREDAITAGAFGFLDEEQVVPTFVVVGGGGEDPEEPEEPGSGGVQPVDGVFHFNEPNGTSLVGSAWSDGEFNGTRLNRLVVVDGALQPSDGNGTSGNTYTMTDNVGNGRGIAIDVAAGITVGGLSLVWRANSSSSYRVNVTPEGAWEFRRSGTWQSQGTISGWNPAVINTLRGYVDAGGVVTFSCNGVTVFSITDGTPLIGTMIGFMVTSDSVDESTFRLNSVGRWAPTSNPPVNSVAPTITGTVQEGQTVGHTNGTWTNSPSFTREWFLDGVSVSTASTYQIPNGSAGDGLYVRVTATANSETASAVSTTATVAAAAPGNTAPVNTAVPTLNSPRAAGQLVTRTAGTWTGNPTPSIAGQWYLDGAPISGETASTYQTSSGQAGQVLTYRETATNSEAPGGVVANSVGLTLGTAQSAPVSTGVPTLDGPRTAGQLVTATAGTFSGNPTPTVTRQWYLDGAAISGATNLTYQSLEAQAGQTLTHRETASNSVQSNVIHNSAGLVLGAVAPTGIARDSAGIYQFNEANGTTLTGGPFTADSGNTANLNNVEIVDGHLRLKAASLSMQEWFMMTAAESSAYYMRVGIKGVIGSGKLHLGLADGGGESYNINILPNGSYEYRKAGTWVDGQPITGWKTDGSNNDIEITREGGNFILRCNGVQVFSVADASPLTGTAIWFSMQPTTAVTDIQLNYFTDRRPANVLVKTFVGANGVEIPVHDPSLQYRTSASLTDLEIQGNMMAPGNMVGGSQCVYPPDFLFHPGYARKIEIVVGARDASGSGFFLYIASDLSGQNSLQVNYGNSYALIQRTVAGTTTTVSGGEHYPTFVAGDVLSIELNAAGTQVGVRINGVLSTTVKTITAIGDTMPYGAVGFASADQSETARITSATFTRTPPA